MALDEFERARQLGGIRVQTGDVKGRRRGERGGVCGGDSRCGSAPAGRPAALSQK